MKQLLVICFLFLSFEISSAKAGTINHYNNETLAKKSFSISSVFQYDRPADISKTFYLSNTALKARYQRIDATTVSFNNPVNVLVIPSPKLSDNYTSPLYLPLIRLLLYPKHYFW